MPRRKAGFAPDGTPKKSQKTKPHKISKKQQFKPAAVGRHWIPETSGVDRDGFRWTIPGHWSDDPAYQPQPPAPPAFSNEHGCHMSGEFILVYGYFCITDNDVPAGQRGHTLKLRGSGLGIGGMKTNGVLHIEPNSWSEFYDRVKSFAYMALAPSFEVPSSKLGHTALCFFDKHSKPLGYALPDLSIDLAMGGGTVSVET